MVLRSVLEVLTVIASVATLVIILLYIGFDHTPGDGRMLLRTVRFCSIAFIVNAIMAFFEDERRHWRFRRVALALDVAMLILAFPLLWPMPQHPWWPLGARIVYSVWFLFGISGIFALLKLSQAIMRIPGRRSSPALMLSVSFLVLVLLGTLLLLLPNSTYRGISLIDAIFTSTSAVCITGLVPVDVSQTFTPTGLTILSVLIEMGGLGVLTFTSVFALFFSGSSSLYTQIVLRDAVYSKSMSRLIPTMLYILGFTVVVQLVGALCIYFTVPDELGISLKERILFSVFTSLSAFCNAGFSNLPQGFSNPALMNTPTQAIYWVTSAIVIAGAIGFPLLVNIKDAIITSLRRRQRPAHLFDMNTKIVAVTFGALFLFGAVAFFILESDNTLRGMTLWQKISQSVFNSTTPRSSGFMSVDPARFLNITLVIVMGLMWVGGAAQSTAGGIKVNTLAAVILNLRAIVRGHTAVTAFRRTIARGSIARANAVLAISVLTLGFYVTVMLALEPGLPARSVIFETVSALFTVGSSMGVTPELGAAAKGVLCTAMFLGRVGIVSLMIGLAGRPAVGLVKYPEDNIIIN